MMRPLLLPLFFLFTANFLNAQMPPICPSDDTPAADLCEDMCIYCNLQAYVGTTAGYTGQAPPGFCGTIENEQWLGFVAGATSATITAIPSNCQLDFGIQVALYPSCFSITVPGGCNGGSGDGNLPVSITVSLTPGQVYYLMIDAYAGDICDFSVTVSPPGAALNGLVIAEEVGLCPGETFTYNGVEYSAPGVVTDTLSSQSGGCDTILLFNLVALTFITDTQTVKFCPGDTVVVGDDFFTEPGTFVLQIPSTTGGCDTILTYTLEYLPQPATTQTIVLQPLEPVVIGGNVYFAPDTVQGTLPSASGGCDTAVTYILVLDLSVPDTCLVSKSFLKKIGQNLSAERGQVILPASDGNFYLAGEKNNLSFIMKVTPNGAVLWTRTFQPAPPLATSITDLIEDSDGMLAGCGIVGPLGASPKGCAFRFDPSTGNLMWVKLLQQGNSEAFAIVEKNDWVGNYLLLASVKLASNVDDAEMWELYRSTGALLGNLKDHFDYGISDVYTSMVVHDEGIYAIGRHIPGFPNPPIPLDKMRMGLTKFDTSLVNPIWTRLSHLDASAFASLSGQDLLIEEEGDSSVLAVYNGSDVADFGVKSSFFLQKTTLDGDLLWVKKYEVQGLSNTQANDIQRMSDGYVITGQARFDSSIWNKIVAKTDFDGNILWAKRVTNSGVYAAGSAVYISGQHQSAVVNDVYYLAGVSQDAPTDVLFLKMTSDGAVSDSCGFVESINVGAEAVPNPVNLPAQLTKTLFVGQLSAAPLLTDSTEMPVATFCISCLLDFDDTLDLGPDIILCKDSTLTFNAGGDFVSYLWQDGSADSTFTANAPNIYWVEVTNECGDKQRDSVLLSVSLAGDIKLPDSTICIGEGLTYTVQDFNTYLWSPATGLSCSTCATVIIQPSATTTYSLYAENAAGCSKTDTFTVVVLPLQTRTETVEFCPGESVVIGGNTYTQPGTVVDTIPGSVGCDTIATYILKFIDTPNSSVSIDCPDNIDIPTNPGTGPIVVNYNLPVAASDCECPGLALTLTQGLPPGSLFPVTTTQVCYEAKDSCGNKAECCFDVTIREEQPCDVKNIGCMKYELLTITRGSTSKNLTYRIRATNTCANKMIYTAIQLPDGLTAVSPTNNSVFSAESGRKYDVRNPNYSPFYSIRFKSQVDSIASGQSDIFEYTLPPQINPDYIHVTSRLYPQVFQEAFLNTFNCPIEIVQDKPENRQDLKVNQLSNLKVFPNPTSGLLFADFSDWQGEQLQVQIFSSQGQRVQLLSVQASDAPQEVALPEGLSSGLYFLEVLRENGEKQALRFVVQR